MAMKWAWKAAKNIALGSVAGYAASRFTSDAMGAEVAGRKGAELGGVLGAVASLPFGRLAKAGAAASGVYARGLKATPDSTVGAALRGASRVGTRAKLVFRRVRGRIVPIRVN